MYRSEFPVRPIQREVPGWVDAAQGCKQSSEAVDVLLEEPQESLKALVSGVSLGVGGEKVREFLEVETSCREVETSCREECDESSGKTLSAGFVSAKREESIFDRIQVEHRFSRLTYCFKRLVVSRWNDAFQPVKNTGDFLSCTEELLPGGNNLINKSGF